MNDFIILRPYEEEDYKSFNTIEELLNYLDVDQQDIDKEQLKKSFEKFAFVMFDDIEVIPLFEKWSEE